MASKITLVSSGYVAPDIARLGWWTISWPDVFGEKASPLPLAERKKQAAREQLERTRCRRLGLVGTVDERLAQSILEVMRPMVNVGGRIIEPSVLGVNTIPKVPKIMPSESSQGISELLDDVD